MVSRFDHLLGAMPLAQSLASRITALPESIEAVPSGSVRRLCFAVDHIDIVVSADDPLLVPESISELPEVAEVIRIDGAHISFRTVEGVRVEVTAVQPDRFGAALLVITGLPAHNAGLHRVAEDRGLVLTDHGLFDNGRLVAGETEADVYACLDLEFIPPTMREGLREVEAAVSGFGTIVTRSDIRGDLHYHSTQSGDGKSSPRAMVKAARAAGYEYVAFTEHGEGVKEGSTRDEMLGHLEVIRDLQETNPDIHILFGCELNIDPDGGLDYDDEFRLQFDFCLASIHSHFDLPEDAQTARILSALNDRSVSAIGHFSGRYAGGRPGVALDVDAILEEFERTGVALEINGAPQRLEAATEVADKAMLRDIPFVITSDAHHTSHLIRMEYGVGAAQKSWVTADRVVNTWPFEELQRWVRDRRDVRTTKTAGSFSS